MKGVFRVVTGKITKINPERFRVRTKMATIGIRGCDVGFFVTEQSANVYVISLKGKESITVVARDKAGGGEWDGLVAGKWEDPDVAKQHLVNVTKDNRIISITQGQGAPSEKPLTPGELSTLLESVTPANATDTGTPTSGGITETGGATPAGDGTAGGTGMGTESSPSVEITPASGTTVDGATPAPTTPIGTDNTLAGDTVIESMIDQTEIIGGIDNTLQAITTPTVPSTDTTVEQAAADAANTVVTESDVIAESIDSVLMTTLDGVMVPVDPALAESLVTTLADNGVTVPTDGTLVLAMDPNTGTVTIDPTSVDTTTDGGSTLPDTTIPTETVMPPEPVLTFTPMGGGTDWSWGSWAVDGMLDHVSVSGNMLPVTDYQAIAAGGTMYNLTGAGTAASVLSDGSVRVLVQGGCNLFVTVGGGAFPNWNGSFSMANGADNLIFAAYGDIDGSGNLRVDPANNLSSFSMQINGASFGQAHVNSWGLSGNLLGPAGAIKPTGAMGTYNFNCFNGSRPGSASGIFGADLH
ncbi:MAG: hypothetical protein A2283_02850 [Lentisphaerae bacterium RIFOXYA12_FULL_48_11]|nr:MAG: hypothetical protein A2283_02850 [Lentisphaerae bacterium RIFOXYA12_FULL_48_11]